MSIFKKDKFLGKAKIHKTEELENDEVRITTKDQRTYTLPKILVDRMVTDEKNDVNGNILVFKLSTIAEDITLLLMKSYHLKNKEVDGLCHLILGGLNNKFEAAEMILWGKGMYDVTIEDIYETLSNASKKELEIADMHSRTQKQIQQKQRQQQ